MLPETIQVKYKSYVRIVTIVFACLASFAAVFAWSDPALPHLLSIFFILLAVLSWVAVYYTFRARLTISSSEILLRAFRETYLTYDEIRVLNLHSMGLRLNNGIVFSIDISSSFKNSELAATRIIQTLDKLSLLDNCILRGDIESIQAVRTEHRVIRFENSLAQMILSRM